MKRYAKITNGTVEAVWLFEEGQQAADLVEVSFDVSVGSTYDGTTFTPPLAPVIGLDEWRLTARAFKRALRQAMKLFPSVTHAHLLDQIDTSVAALPDYHPAKDAWRDVTEFQRSHPDVAALAAPFGLTGMQMDAIFRAAEVLERGGTEAEALAAAGLA